MSESVHGHDVMKMMVESGKKYTQESLESDIIEQFGADTTFYTCSEANMTAKEIIVFLKSRDKFIDTDDGFSTDPGKICDH